jgi:hypothetical protein
MCPNYQLLKSYKVYPRKIDFNYIKDQFFLYVYLDPFQELTKPLKVNVNGHDYCFAYNPIYLGKGTGSGYRQNQHLTNFQNDRERNIKKIQIFQEINKNMALAAAKSNNDKPWSWKEYKDQFIIILDTFEDPKMLVKTEMDFINKIGTLWEGKGPLTNKIKNAYKMDFIQSTGNNQIF